MHLFYLGARKSGLNWLFKSVLSYHSLNQCGLAASEPELLEFEISISANY